MDFYSIRFPKQNTIVSVLVFCVAAFAVVFCTELYQEEQLVQHNKYRRRYATPPLSMSEELNEAAVKCAEYYAEIGKINHKCPHKKVANFSGGAGENLYYFAGAVIPLTNVGGGAGWSWWTEHKSYNHSNIKLSHFTQMIWKSTTHLGFGCKYDDNKKAYCAALYYPPGNLVSASKENLNPRDESVKE